VERQVEIEVAQIVLPRAADADHVIGHRVVRRLSVAGLHRLLTIVPKATRAREQTFVTRA
jgi:hypothetical protein